MRAQLTRAREQLIRQRDSSSRQKAVRLLEKLYDFFTATAVSYSATAISRTSLIRERVVKRLWNVGNAPATPQPLYLLGFQQIRERWNFFFENQFF